MSDEYIRKEDAVDAATQDSTENRTHSFRAGQARSASRIKALKPADVAPVVHAYWRDTGSGQECSACKEIQYGYDTGRYFCANCGAKMDGKGEE